METTPLHSYHYASCLYLEQRCHAQEEIQDVYYCNNREEHDEERSVVKWNQEYWT